ncbi:hypothetical protein LDL08_19830 [Nonomuraea glycinis]|uniref:Uncharacterized protein n=1 Tax=Nonomuraea glycinis TaxID=2047744 RepID=A0A918E888_9ACTN|nr:hypothetical protein [Nonomuraea glycinis]MCA2178442.1 hypothetical protein [Nonomuraea glycinis]GGP12251.1 hypothetical protein GCM10012278_59270 [Nonomuraea glycinis]
MNDSEVDDLVIQIAVHLDGFTPQIRPGHPAYLIGPEGARLVVHPLWRQEGRITVLGVYPDGYRSLFPDLRRHQISVSATRSPEHVAKKIARGLLPGYLRDLATCRARLSGQKAEEATRAELVETLLTMLPGATFTEKQRETVLQWRLGATSGSFAVYGDTTSNSIEIRMADRELTERVAYAIQQRSM